VARSSLAFALSPGKEMQSVDRRANFGLILSLVYRYAVCGRSLLLLAAACNALTEPIGIPQCRIASSHFVRSRHRGRSPACATFWQLLTRQTVPRNRVSGDDLARPCLPFFISTTPRRLSCSSVRTPPVVSIGFNTYNRGDNSDFNIEGRSG